MSLKTCNWFTKAATMRQGGLTGTRIRFRSRGDAVPRCIAAIALAIGLALPSHIRGAEPVRVVVDSSAQVLHVLRGAERLQTFDDIAIGRNGTTADKRAGDGRTPIGQYRVLAIRESTRFHRFVWLSYPTAVQARRAHARGDLPVAARRAIEHADDGGRPPP